MELLDKRRHVQPIENHASLTVQTAPSVTIQRRQDHVYHPDRPGPARPGLAGGREFGPYDRRHRRTDLRRGRKLSLSLCLACKRRNRISGVAIGRVTERDVATRRAHS